MTSRAGESAAVQARAAFQQAPVRSVLGRVLRVHTEERAWRVGAAGEASVGRLLDKLPRDRWRVFHDLPLSADGVNVDHLVVGTGGVFSINTKNLSGKVWLAERALLVNGQKTKYLKASFHEACNVAKKLSSAVGEDVSVRPMLVLICEELTRKAEPSDVVVVRRKEMLRWFKGLPGEMAIAKASRIARAAGARSTWSY